jgi:arginine/lysine/ornithine decarboxylase
VISTNELARRRGVTAVDPTHVLIETAGVGLTGYAADDWLRDRRQIDVELVDHRRIMPLITFAHGEEEIERFVTSLRAMVDEQGEPGSDTGVGPLPSRRELRTEQSIPPREAFFAQTETITAREAVGRISAELVTPYPPGIPAIAPGEVYTQAIVDYLEEVVAADGFVEGAADQSLAHLRVVTR